MRTLIKRGLIEHIFSAFSIERWNDHPRTAQFTEMDKQAHKAMIAWVVARTEEDHGAAIDWNALIEGSIFEFLHRVVLTDIKPPVFHRLMADEAQQRQLNQWVLQQLQPLLEPLPQNIYQRCCDYFLKGEPSKERHILSAAHFMATRWEFGFISHWSRPLYGIDQTEQEINDGVKKHADLKAVAQFIDALEQGHKKGLMGFISLVGQLQFQKRWAQVQRMPATSVLGHLFMVALLAWLVSLEVGAGSKRQQNNFYCGLFHDLPEVLTRDIISPVKYSVEGLGTLIKEVEAQELQSVIFPLIPDSWHDDLLYYVTDEFANRIRKQGKVSLLDRELNADDNRPEFDAVDGKLLEICDKLSAFIEASQSVKTGITAPPLEEGRRRILEEFGNRSACGFDMGVLFDYFR